MLAATEKESDEVARERVAKAALDACIKASDAKKRKFEKPVSWLLGRQLIASLKSTLLYTAFGNKIDARDWMDAKLFPPVKNGEVGQDGAAAIQNRRQAIAKAWSELYQRDETADFTADGGEFWFDYISDTGDGMTATYSVAYLCLSDLWIQGDWTAMPAVEVTQEQREKNDLPEALLVRMRSKESDRELLGRMEKLPRGEFLLVGGDTSYHMADYASLSMRFQQPFKWANEDLRADLEQPAVGDGKAENEREIRRLRPIFGIPGNHDYYDMLDGFRRQFRVPPSNRAEDEFHAEMFERSQLAINGFRRHQETSYIALRLPYDWMLWGLDTEVGKIDERQREFFKRVKAEYEPKKLIVCTSAPTTVFGKYADKDDEKCAKAFLQLDLPRPFLRSENEAVPASQTKDEPPAEPRERKLADDEIRLDLAGDVHHYARYWGPSGPSAFPRDLSDQAPKEKANYASVMSGLGGAFHHPSTTYVDEIREQAVYPDPVSSRKHVAEEIFNPWRVVKGGGVWFVGGLVALILSFAAIADDSTRPAIHNFKAFVALGLTEPARYMPTVESSDEAKRHQAEIQPTILTNAMRRAGLVSDWQPQLASDVHPDCYSATERAKPFFLWGRCRVEWPVEYAIGFWLLILTLLTMGLALWRMRSHYLKWKNQQEARQKAAVADDSSTNDEHVRAVNRTIWGFTLGITLQALIGILLVMAYRNFITPFGNSLLVLLTFCWAAAAIYLSLKYSDWLFEQASMRTIRRRDWAITWVLAACAFFSVAIGLWVFGKANPAAFLVADTVSVLVVIAVPLLLLLAALKLGGAHQHGWGKVGMALIGVWHAILQITVPVMLIKKGTWLTVMASVALVFIFWWVGRMLMSKDQRVLLTIAWIVFGALMLAAPPVIYCALRKYGYALPPYVLSSLFSPHPVATLDAFSTYEWWVTWNGWWQIFPIFLCGIFGAFLSCTWLGWYFGVCLGFNGHNNEAGGAARIEKFKQIVRIRLTKDSLTGYVIGVKDPQRCGKLLHPFLIDIFHLTYPNQGKKNV